VGDNTGEGNAISRSGFRSIFRGALLLLLVLVLGTSGYMVIEGWPLLEGLYMTVITITTVGYGEVRTVSEPGRVFTVFLIFSGMGIMAYTLGIVAQIMVEFQVRDLIGRRKLGLKLKNIKDHYILCGYGRIGEIIAHELKANGIPIMVIEQNAQPKSGD
jgi:voltage-gated potassium channel